MASYFSSFFSSSSIKLEDANNEFDYFLSHKLPARSATASTRTPTKGASQSIYPTLSAEMRQTKQPSTSAYTSPSLTPDTRRRVSVKTDDHPITPLTYVSQKKNKAIVAPISPPATPFSPPATPLRSREQLITSRSRAIAAGSSRNRTQETSEMPLSGQLQVAPRRSTRTQALGTPVRQPTLPSPPSTPLATSGHLQTNARSIEPPARDVGYVSAIVNPRSPQPSQTPSRPLTSAVTIKIEELEFDSDDDLLATPMKHPRQSRNNAPVLLKTPPQVPQNAESLSTVRNARRPHPLGAPTPRKPSAATIKLDELEFDEPIIASEGALTSSERPALTLQGPSGIFRNGETLHFFQANDLHLLLNRERGELVCGTNVVNNVGYVLAYDMGCGKTVMSIALIVINTPPCDFEGVKATLVVVPSQGVLNHWIGELKIFAPHLKFFAYRSGKDALRQDVDVVLCTYDQVQLQFSARKKGENAKCPLFDILWYRIIADEAHTFRNPESKKASGIWGLRKKHALCLTGTPAQNTLVDYYPLFKFLEVKYENINDLDSYYSKVFGKRQKVPPNPTAQGILDTLKQSFFIVREKIDSTTGEKLVKLPPRYDHVVDVHLTRNERAVHEHSKTIGKGSFPKFMHMRQACDHPALVSQWVNREQLCGDDLQKSHTFSSDGIFNFKCLSSKMRSMLKILRERPPKEKTIIFTHFTSLFDGITQALGKWGISWVKYSGDMKNADRENALKTIKEDDSCTVIIISILAGGTGLNITSCSSVILLDPWWNPYVEEQAISRVHRFGQDRTVNVYHLVTVDSVEVYIMEVQVRKRNLIDGSFNVVFEDERVDNFESEEKNFQRWLANPSYDRLDDVWRSMYQNL